MHSNVISNWNGFPNGLGLSSTATFNTCTLAIALSSTAPRPGETMSFPFLLRPPSPTSPSSLRCHCVSWSAQTPRRRLSSAQKVKVRVRFFYSPRTPTWPGGGWDAGSTSPSPSSSIASAAAVGSSSSSAFFFLSFYLFFFYEGSRQLTSSVLHYCHLPESVNACIVCHISFSPSVTVWSWFCILSRGDHFSSFSSTYHLLKRLVLLCLLQYYRTLCFGYTNSAQ